MSSQDFVDQILQAVAGTFQPLAQALSSQTQLNQILNDLGWGGLTSQQVTSITQSLQGLSGTLTSIASDSGDQLLTDLPQAFAQILALATTSTSGLTDFWSTFPGDLLDYLLYKYLQSQVPLLFGILSFLGILTADPTPADGTTTPPRGTYTKLSVDFTMLPKIATQPNQFFQTVYGWGTPSFNYARLTNSMAALLQGIGLGVQTTAPAKSLLDMYYAQGSASRPSIMQLAGTPFQLNDQTGTTQVVAKVLIASIPIPPDSDNTKPPDGFALFPILIGSGSTDFELSSGLDLKIDGGFTSTAPVLLEIHPSGLSIRFNPIGGASLSATVTLTAQASPPLVLLGSATGTHIEASKAHLSLGATGPDSSGSFELKVELGADALALFLDFSEGDGFLSSIMPAGKQEVDLSFLASWSNVKGFSFSGGPSLEATIPLNVSLAGVIELDSVYLGFTKGDGSGTQAALTAAVSGSLNLGPVSASVDKVGLQISLQTVDESTQPPGILGKANLAFAFKPPDGIGIDVDADVVSGGGYLAYDATKKEYSGALQLEAAGIGLAAYGFLDTVMPGGGSGYSLVLVINAQFGDPGLEIGFGVALTGIGGLVAINRTTDMNVVIADVKNGTIQNFLFNSDPVDNAPQIISGLAALFPAEQGEFVFGPMVQLQWGAGGLVTANIGVFLELTKAPKVIIAGSLSAGIPDPDAALIQLNVDVDGFIDFQAQELGFDAEIYNSYLAIFSISGGMSLRAGWGANPIFLLSVGGFNPNFQPPAGYPTIPRIKVALCTSNDPTINLDGYLAVTSNTFQTGAQLYAYASLGNFWAKGDLGFDSLFIFNPFSFQIQIAASFSIGTGSSVILSASLSGSLSGPAPWIADGNVSFSFLFFHPSVSFHAVIGSAGQPQAESTAQQVEAALASALGSPANWSSNNVGGANSVVSINQPTPPNSNTVMMDPLGQLTVKQSAVPLNTTVTAYNNTPLESPVTITVSGASIEGQNAGWAYVPDDFAPASYESLPTDEQLSAPSFESLPGGVTVSPSYATASADTTNAPPTYMTTYIDDAVAGPIPRAFPYVPNPANFLVAVASGTAQQSALANSGPRKYASSQAATMSIAPDTYVLMSTDSMKPTGMPAGASSLPWIQANAAKQSYLSANTTEDGYVQIVPATEVGAG